jgi:hypothetical protein
MVDACHVQYIELYLHIVMVRLRLWWFWHVRGEEDYPCTTP